MPERVEDGIGAARLALLTKRERQIAELMAIGMLNREIAQTLNIEQKTVDSHRQTILKKLDLRSNVDLARWAIRIGLVTNETDYRSERKS